MYVLRRRTLSFSIRLKKVDTINEANIIIASYGGHQNRKKDPPPGPAIMKAGLQKLVERVHGLKLCEIHLQIKESQSKSKPPILKNKKNICGYEVDFKANRQALAQLYATFLLQQFKAKSVLSEGRESHGSAPLQNIVSFLFQCISVCSVVYFFFRFVLLLASTI